MPELSKRTEVFTDSVIRRMTRVSLEYGAVNLSQGFPDFEPPTEITDRLAEVAAEGPHQYALTWGAQNFREALAKKQEHCFFAQDRNKRGYQCENSGYCKVLIVSGKNGPYCRDTNR